jgi:hypothetical protein
MHRFHRAHSGKALGLPDHIEGTIRGQRLFIVLKVADAVQLLEVNVVHFELLQAEFQMLA